MMRRKQKPIPTESSFKEYAANQSKKPRQAKPKRDKVSSTVKNMFKDKSESRGRRSRSDDSKKKDFGRRAPSKDSRRTESKPKFSRKDDSRKDSRDRTFRRDDSRGKFSRNKNEKHDRRKGRGKSFKEDRRNDYQEKKKGSSWESVPKSMRGVERRKREASRGKFGNSDKKFARTNSGVKELFDAVCMKCKNPCKVPFKPTGKMGVSCTNCYDKNKSPFKGGKKKPGTKTHGQRIEAGNRKAFKSNRSAPKRRGRR